MPITESSIEKAITDLDQQLAIVPSLNYRSLSIQKAITMFTLSVQSSKGYRLIECRTMVEVVQLTLGLNTAWYLYANNNIVLCGRNNRVGSCFNTPGCLKKYNHTKRALFSRWKKTAQLSSCVVRACNLFNVAPATTSIYALDDTTLKQLCNVVALYQTLSA